MSAEAAFWGYYAGITILTVGVGEEVQESKIISLPNIYAVLRNSFSGNADRCNKKRKQNK